jgi:hypothetical protein
MSDENSFAVNFASGTRYDLDMIRRRKQAFMPDGGHSWVIAAVYGLDNPDAEMDSMELGEDNFVGVTNIHCLLCIEDYSPEKRHHKCPQKPTP